MTAPQNDRFVRLTATAKRLAESVALNGAADTLAGIERQSAALVKQAQTLQNTGYGAAGPLNSIIMALAGITEKIKLAADARLTAYRGALGDEAAALTASVGATGMDEQAVAAAESAAATLEAQITHAQSDLDGLVAPLKTALYASESHLSLIAVGVEAWSEFSGQRGAGEYVVTAAESEWVGGTGRDQAPDGILYLTNSRLIFEQKEKVGKTLGFFGGKKVQEVEWAFDLSQIGGVRAKNAGMFGGKDMLFVEHGGSEYTIEVKGRASNDEWAAYIECAKSGAYVIAAPEIAVPDAAEQAQVLSRIERERAERRSARIAQHAANEAGAAQARAEQQATKQAFGAMAAAAAKFTNPNEADEDSGASAKLSGLAAAFKKASAPDDPETPANGGEKGQQGGGPKGGNVGQG